MLVLFHLISILCSKIEKNNIGNKYFTINFHPEPELRLVQDAEDTILKRLALPPILKTDPGVIFFEELEFNVFRFKFMDGYICKNSEHSNFDLNVYKTADDEYTEWSMVKIDNYYQIRTLKRGLCLMKSSARKGKDTEFAMKVGICRTSTPFQFTITEIPALNVEAVIEPPPPTTAERLAEKLDEMLDRPGRELSALSGMASNAFSRKFSSRYASSFSRNFSG